ncbi:hypothetical protein HER10_EVM0010144 [Colletotrichum scovillei]|uniref:Uncharacterized protein n=1 Tax=Colletotrichum scovillei TaxID=1209932 RepID=A0A9P7REP4_9PEZI|nr:uncharacterized protein HER10_EVM0010144 [Colletotrichum scovillei]KAF4780201.1 hypothetical protein HER10_EVM0010144 [Colletotrichum scovillei]KAG7057108.1 hypothetical protein JMJ77_0004500 [Colletotrichum scovillei]KAG7075709.1 hypothetical protein JMJ76_0012986 [Colletotrichum scovillei]KAG7082904.1 hypothetical protein JMJ78_0008357 [Colletotrichum scovillei]
MAHRRAMTPNTQHVNYKAVAWFGEAVLHEHKFVHQDRWWQKKDGRPGRQECIAKIGSGLLECYKPLPIPLTYDLDAMKMRVIGNLDSCNGPNCQSKQTCPPSEYTETCLVWSNYQAPSKSKKHHYPAYEGVGADLGEANAP